jgi:hypothetical protein
MLGQMRCTQQDYTLILGVLCLGARLFVATSTRVENLHTSPRVFMFR